jgi:hypothetical protein
VEDGRAVGEHGREVEIHGIALPLGEGLSRIEAERIEERAIIRHFRHGHAAEQMGAHVVGFWWRRVVDVAPYVEIEVVRRAFDLRERDDAGVGGNVLVTVEGGDDFLDVFGA